MSKLINDNAAGVDISSQDHYVCVPGKTPKEYGEVKKFGCYTKDLHLIADWLNDHSISTVAMESTGVYWMELFSVLQDRGFEVLLVNAHHVKNVPGRKTDVMDAQWLQKLHSYGLLNGSYQPQNTIRTLRTIVRKRSETIREMSKQTNRLIKCLEQMNIKTRQVISDIHGKTGTAVIKAILRGERSAKAFLAYKHPRIKASNEDFMYALEGNWKDEQIYCLKLAQEAYEFFQKQLHSIDNEIERILSLIESDCKVEYKKLKVISKPKNAPKFHARQKFQNIIGVDVTAIPGFKENSALTVLSETGHTLKKTFPTIGQFLSWLNLIPDMKISGGKVLSSKMRRKKNKAGQAFRESAGTLWRSKTPLGEYLRSKKAKKGAGIAIVATAKKQATIYYYMVTKREEYDPERLKINGEQALLRKFRFYERKAMEMKDLYEKKVV